MASTQQMNFRIDSELKRRGDEVFARYGYTPSEAVRRIYELAVRGDDESINLLGKLLVDEAEEALREAERQSRIDEIRSFQANLAERLKALGLLGKPMEASREHDRQMYLDAMMERMAERGIA